MSMPLQLRHEPNRQLDVMTGEGALLWRYVYAPATPANEATRPFAHPVCSLAGDVLTNFRPNDHPWHHALSLTLSSVDGVNFWGGPTYAPEGGYQWRDNHGAQLHRAWISLAPERLEERLAWCEPKSGHELLHEHRVLETSLSQDAWSLRWTCELVNATGRELVLGNYEALGGLTGSHYTGLQFRGARDLLVAAEHGDPTGGVTSEGGRAGEAAVHGTPARWMEWTAQHDGSLRRTRIRFENPEAPLPWFVRPKLPLAAFAFHREKAQLLPSGGTLRFAHVLTFSNA
jgi:hypothetical protein